MIRIEAPYFTAGIIPGVQAAPIIKYMLDWTADGILAYCTKKGWKVEVV